MQEKGQNFAPIKQRIIQYIEFKRIIKQDFFKNTGISPSNFKGNGLNSEIGGDKLVEILTIYPEINPTWLLTGRGDMLLGVAGVVKEAFKEPLKAEKVGECRRCGDLERVINAQESEIDALKQQIQLLNRLLAPVQEAPAEPQKASA